MGKSLIIAEKPSVAADIARALGGLPRVKDYFEGDRYVVSSAVGHLVEIKAPEGVEVKRGKWSFANLPVIPSHFDLNPIARNEERLKLLTRLIKRKDIDRIINACDAGREGELIFRLIAQYAGARQPIQRLWLQSMTPKAIREAFERLRDGEELMPLADAARCRSEADWLVGINGTRAMTAFNSQDGGFYLTTVGRVQTPTLTIVVEREERIKRFVSRPYFEVRANFGVAAGEYPGRWFDPAFQKDENDPEKRPERLWDRAKAEAIVAACEGRQGSVAEETRPATQTAPLLFDLTTLQREANSRFGFSARATLSIAQALYEKHKVLTYPRTDSRHLPEDYQDTVRETLGMLRDEAAQRVAAVAGADARNGFGVHAARILEQSWVRPNKRVFNNAEVRDHFAIIPTLQAPRNLSEPEAKLYDLVVRRFLAIFFPAAEYRVTTRTTTVAEHNFRTEGRVLVDPGWLAVYGREASKAGADDLAAVAPGESAATVSIEVADLATKPPSRYTEATLLSAMEGAGKLVEDDELRDAMAGKGLGTPATRAAIIEGLINENYLLREGRELVPTTKAFQLLTLLRGLGVTELTMPELTGEWEYKLARIEQGELQRDAFMEEISRMAAQIVERAKNYGATTVPGDYATLTTPCPVCGGQVRENYKRFACTNCEFSISKTPGSRQLEVAEAEALLRERTIGPLQGFRSKMGRPFAAILRLSADNKLEFDFGQDDEDESEPVDFTDHEALGECPKCGASVYEHGMSYVCERSVGTERSCDFRSGKVILQQEIEPAQMRKLLADGKTDLLQGFVSSRTRRKFKAFLVRGPNGKVGFEFEPRKNDGKARKGGKAADDDTGVDAGDGSARSAAGSTQAGAAAASGTVSSPAPSKGKKASAPKKPVTAKKAGTGAKKGGAPAAARSATTGGGSKAGKAS